MSKTIAEVVAFLDSKVGTRVTDKSNANLNGQCVALIKSLMEFLGVSDPYRGRGNAKDAGDAYIREGIGSNGPGSKLTVIVNRSMGAPYGHIWVDVTGIANYESNGKTALITTKNTRPFSQGEQFINFDKYITTGTTNPPAGGGSNNVNENFIKRTYYMVNNQTPTAAEVSFHMQKSSPESFINGFGDNPLWKVQTAAKDQAVRERDQARTERDNANNTIKAKDAEITKLKEQIASGGGVGTGSFTAADRAILTETNSKIKAVFK